MAAQLTQWHVLFYAALQEHGSSGAAALAEVLLSKAPQRGDVLLLRKRELAPEEHRRADAQARTLRPLWRLLQREALLEYKSPGRPPRRRDLAKLLGYGGQLHHLRFREIGAYDNLLLCLVATRLTAAVRDEIQRLQAPMEAVAPGYLLVKTIPYRLLVVDLTEATRSDKDEWMAIFVPGMLLPAKVKQWLEEHMPAKDVPGSKKLKGHNEVLARLLQATPPKDILKAAGAERLLANLTPRQILRAAGAERLLAGLPPEQRLAGLPPEQRLAGLPPEQRLAGLPPEQRLAGLPPEQRLAGLPPEQRLADLPPEEQLLAMPDSALAALSKEYLRTLPAGVQAAIRKRIRAASGNRSRAAK